MMNWIDYSLIAIVGLSALISLMRGFVKEALSLVIWFLAFFIAKNFYVALAEYLTSFTDPLLRNGVSVAILFVTTLIVGAVVNNFIGLLVHRTGLSGTDRLLGVIFGAIRGVLIVSALFFFLDAFTQLPSTREWHQSQLLPHLSHIVKWFFDYFGENSSLLMNAK